MASLQTRNLVKAYGSTEVLHGIDLEIEDGEFVVLVGPSGCGKSTLLRMIAGLDDITSGELIIGGTLANRLPPQARNISMVFQSYALFPHMSVRRNIGFGPRIRGETAAAIADKVAKAAEILNLTPYLDRFPRQLSGGQRQRVAMGRTIVREPSLFLFDEPLSNLDAKLRAQMRTEIKSLHQKLKRTIVYVTHDQIEAMTLADRIVVINGGRIEQIGTPLQLYDRPANRFVGGFLGSPSMSFLPGVVEREGGSTRVRIAPDIAFTVAKTAAFDGQEVEIGVRPERYQIAADGIGAPLCVTVVEPTGSETHIVGAIGDCEVRVVLRERFSASSGDVLKVRVDPEQIHVFDSNSGARV